MSGYITTRALARQAIAELTAEADRDPQAVLDLLRARAELPHAELVAGNAESLPFADASFDAVVSVFLFHELPRHARRTVWAEARRVLRPGGRFIVVDSVQRSDSQEIAYFVDRFSRDMHEPFYREYIEDDLAAGLRGEGFAIESVEPAYLAKVVTARTPQPGAATP